MLPSFVTSTWISDPRWLCSSPQMTSAVRMSMCDKRFLRYRTNTACTVEDAIDSRDAIASRKSRWRHPQVYTRSITGAGVRFGL
jgi:hypothetical protein